MTDTRIALEGAAVRGARGPVFGPVDTESRGAVTVVLGGRGSGRTSLLLSLAGRMRLSEGRALVLGRDSATRAGLAATRRISGIAGFEAIDALEPGVPLGDTLRERLGWATPWWRRTPPMTTALSGELLGEAFGEYEQPSPGTLVRELNPAEEMLLRISLALIERPEMLCVDDLDALRDPAERALVAERLRILAERGLRIVVATSDPGDAALLADPASSTAPDLIEI